MILKYKLEKVLVVDPALTSGYCIIDLVNTEELEKGDSYTHLVNKIIEKSSIECHISNYNYVVAPTNMRSQESGTGKVCNWVYEKFKEICVKHRIDHVVIEKYYFSKRSATGSTINVSIRTALYMLCADLGLEYTEMEISDWKRRTAGRVRPSPADKKKWGKNANKMFIKSALEEQWGLTFPETYKNEKGRNIKFKYDICDAIGQAIAFCQNYYKIGKKSIVFEKVEIRM